MLHADTGIWKLYAQLYWHRLNIVFCSLRRQDPAWHIFFTSENLYARYIRQQYVFPQVYMLGKRRETLVLGYKFRCISFYATFSTQP
jgi:hypothetical protein